MNSRIALAILLVFMASHAGAGVVNFPKRKTFAEYAETKNVEEVEVTKRYAATVIVRCNGQQATAQFTGSADVLTTAGHLFFDREKCRQISDESGCEITIETANGRHKYTGFQMLDYGYRKRMEAIKEGRMSCPRKGLPWEDDWSILRLTNLEAVRNVKKEVRPFRIPMLKDVHKGRESVVAVGGAALDFFFRTENGGKVYPRSIQECGIQDIWPTSGGGSYVETDCDTAKLMSGGPLIRRGQNGDTLIGIHMGSFESKEELQEAMRTGNPTTKDYKSGEWAGLYVSLDGELLKSLQAILGLNGEI